MSSLVSRETAGAAVRGRLVRIRNAARKLVSGDAQSVLTLAQAVRVTSSRSAAVDAEAVEGTARGRDAAFQIKVTRLARTQLNRGQSLASADANGIQAGANGFSIQIGSGPSHTVSFTNDSTDTNEQALEKLAQAINGAATGLTAAVVTDPDAGTVHLELSGDQSGAGRAFTIADLSGNAVAATGIAAVTTTAVDARFVVNGVARTAASNTVLIDDGRVRLTLKAETGPNGDADEAGAVISVAPDALSQSVLDLADALNGLRDTLAAEGSTSGPRVHDKFTAVLAENSAALAAMGVSVDGNGRVLVDPERLAASIADDQATTIGVLGGTDGVGAKISAAAEEALEASMFRSRASDLFARQVVALPPAITPIAGSERGLLVDILG